MAAKNDKGNKTKETYEEAAAFLEGALNSAFQSFRQERLGRKKLANRLGLTDEIIRNIERGHRKMVVADFILLSLAMEQKPEAVLEELLRRFNGEINNWRKKSGY